MELLNKMISEHPKIDKPLVFVMNPNNSIGFKKRTYKGYSVVYDIRIDKETALFGELKDL